jgi:hypothetical protein
MCFKIEETEKHEIREEENEEKKICTHDGRSEKLKN